MREWTLRINDTHYCLGSVMGPHPFPTIVRDFQAVISKEIKEQMLEKEGRLPDAVLACVGGGSNAIGSFYHFIEDTDVRLIGCEAAGLGIDTSSTAATVNTGSVGIFHGMKSYFCQNEYGQIAPVYSISAGLDYPGVGPEHAWLHDTGRAEYVPVTDEEAVCAFEYLARTEGYGAKRFFSSCQESGIDGLILSDLPFEEKEEFLPFGQAYDVALISQIALSSKDRTAMIAKEAEGFLYMVSDPGMEGTKNGAQSELPSMVKMVRQNTDIPCAVGFETSTLEQIKEMAEFADGVIAASALVGLLGKYGTDAPRYIGEYVKEIKMALKTSFSR